MTPGGFHKKTDPNEIHNEIIDLMNINAICDPVPDFPIEISYATGGLLKDRMPIGAAPFINYVDSLLRILPPSPGSIR